MTGIKSDGNGALIINKKLIGVLIPLFVAIGGAVHRTIAQNIIDHSRLAAVEQDVRGLRPKVTRIETIVELLASRAGISVPTKDLNANQ